MGALTQRLLSHVGASRGMSLCIASGCRRGFGQPEAQVGRRSREPAVGGRVALLQLGQRRGFYQPVDDEPGPAAGTGHGCEGPAPECDLVWLVAAQMPGLSDPDRSEVVSAVQLPVGGRVVGGEDDGACRCEDAVELGQRTFQSSRSFSASDASGG